MKRSNIIKIIFPFTIFCIFAIFACAAKTPVKKVVMEDIKSNLIFENVVFRSFIAAPNIVSPDAAIIECTNSSINYLTMKNLFKKIEKGNGKSFKEPTLFVDVTLTALRIVSTGARFWGSFFSGRSHMKILVKLTDDKGVLVAEQELLGAPNAYGAAWSIGSTDRNLPTNMGILLGDFILANVSKK